MGWTYTVEVRAIVLNDRQSTTASMRLLCGTLEEAVHRACVCGGCETKRQREGGRNTVSHYHILSRSKSFQPPFLHAITVL